MFDPRKAASRRVEWDLLRRKGGAQRGRIKSRSYWWYALVGTLFVLSFLLILFFV